MAKDKKAFGDFLRKMIKQAEISQAAFYEAVEITKPYFKNFILTFIQVAAQIVFMGIVYYIGASHVITEMGEIDGFEGLISWFGKIAPNMLIIIAMSIMMIKPPRCLTNLIK